MIKNEQQMGITASKLESLRSSLTRLQIKHPRRADFDFFTETTQRQIARMEREVELYELAKLGDVDGLVTLWNQTSAQPTPDSMTIGDLIALTRVARGFTQQELACRLGVEQAHVARYERHDYSGYSMETLTKILTALGLRLALLQASQDQPDPPRISRPKAA